MTVEIECCRIKTIVFLQPESGSYKRFVDSAVLRIRLVRMRIIVMMVENILNFSVKDIDDCNENLIVMMMGYNSMG